MDTRKIIKISVAVALLIIAAVLAITRTEKNKIKGVLADRVELICVATGEVFAFKRKDLAMLPAENPKTGEQTLVPCYRDQQGHLRVDSHYVPLLEDLGDLNRYVDVRTLEVQMDQAG